MTISSQAIYKMSEIAPAAPVPIGPPKIPAGVVPDGVAAPVLAADDISYTIANEAFVGQGFPGFPYLSRLATIAEFRAMADSISKEITREWIEFTSTGGDGGDNEKIKAIENEFERLDIRGVFTRAAQHDCYFGRAQIFLKFRGNDNSRDKLPLVLSPKTIQKGSLESINTVEAIWTTPSMYNANDPSAPDFYKPVSWFMLGRQIHASRLLTVVTRELPDMLKPAYNFSGMSLSQLAEPYVNNWLLVRSAVTNLVDKFSITALKTAMSQVLQGGDGADVIKRAQLFAATRSNMGLLLLDKDMEEIVQQNVPLSGLSELQAQAQEHMCAVSRLPAIILTGISPAGLNATSDGEIRVFYDWISSQQNSHWLYPLEIILKVVQLHLFGEIDDSIGVKFKPLYQESDAEKATRQLNEANRDAIYLDRQAISANEVRDKLANDPDSGYQGLEVNEEVDNENDQTDNPE